MANYGPYPATVAAIHDGDTLDVNLILHKERGPKIDKDLGFNVHRNYNGITLVRQSVRLYGCNSAELSTPAGKDALAYLQTLLKIGDTVTLLSHGWDKYGGRIDGTVTLGDGRDLTAAMISAGQAVAWDGTGPKPIP